MPLYDYQCQKCGHRFEKIQKFSERIVTKCPECGGRVERVISAPAVQFKGSGWYVTDYAKKSQASSPSDSGKESKATETTKSDSGSKERSSKEGSSNDSSSKDSSKESAKTSSSKKADKNK
jgi:putative FmdB family regulatory protein